MNDSVLIKANLLLNQSNTKKSNKAVVNEITKMSETFGMKFDIYVYSMILTELDFKDFKSPQNSVKNPKIQFIVQELPNFLEKECFVNQFSMILDKVNLNHYTKISAFEFFDCLTKLCKLNIESQLKLLVAMNLSQNEVFLKEAGKVFSTKCKEIEKEVNLPVDILQMLISIARKHCPENSKVADLFSACLNKTMFQGFSGCSKENFGNTVLDAECLLEDLNELDTTDEELVPFEMIYIDIGSSLLNSGVQLDKASKLIDFTLTEKRLSEFIMFLMKGTYYDDKEHKMTKLLLRLFEIDANLEDEKKPYNLDMFYKQNKAFFDDLDEKKLELIFSGFDSEKFYLDKKSIEVFSNVMSKLKIRDWQNCLMKLLLKTTWVNELNQLLALEFIFSVPQEFLIIKPNKIKKQPPPLQQYISLSGETSPGYFLGENLLNPEVIRSFLNLAKGNLYLKVKHILFWGVNNLSVLMLFPFSEVNISSDDFLAIDCIIEIFDWSEGCETITSNLTIAFEELNFSFAVQLLHLMYKTNNAFITCCLELCHKTGSVMKVLNHKTDMYFKISLALIASKKEYLNLDQWLNDMLSKTGEVFVESLLRYIKVKILSKIEHLKKESPDDNKEEEKLKTLMTNKENVLKNSQFTFESLANLFKFLFFKQSSFSKNTVAEIKFVYKSIFELFDELHFENMNTEEVEDNTRQLFSSYFKQEISLASLTETLKKFKNSNVLVESQVFAYFTYSVLDEYRFCSDYPPQQLKALAALFGSLLANRFLDGIVELIALKYILNSLGRKQDSNLFIFACIALEQFIDNIVSLFPSFLDKLVKLAKEKLDKEKDKSHPIFITIIDKLEKRKPSTSLPQQTSTIQQNQFQLEQHSYDKKDYYSTEKFEKFEKYLGQDMTDVVNLTTLTSQEEKEKKRTALNVVSIPQSNKINELVPHQLLTAPSEVVGKIKFIFNSMSKTNISEKAKELKAILSSNNEHCLKWFSNYLIVDRVSVENNNHNYNELINLLDLKEINALLIKDTVNYIKKLLQCEKVRKDDTKTILKKLGSWLGLTTLSKSKPILFKDLDLKEILFDAYCNGKLQILVFFICKIIETTIKNPVFHPKNPYIYTLLSVLAEISVKPNLKFIVKNEIEGLFKKMDIDLNTYLNRNYLDKFYVVENSPDFKQISESHATTSSMEVKFPDLYSQLYNLDTMNILYNSLCSVKKSFNKKDFLTLIIVSLQSAINEEVLSSVVDRAITISFAASKVIVRKDFYFEKNEQVYKQAFVLSIKALAGSLAMVTCKEPLRTNFIITLKDNFSKNNLDPDAFGELITSISSNNKLLDEGCQIIQEFVIKKALEMIETDEVLSEIKNRQSNPVFMKTVMELPDSLKDQVNPNLRYNTNNLYNVDNSDLIRVYNEYDYSHHSNVEKLYILRIILPALKEFSESSTFNNIKNFNGKLEILLKNIRTLSLDQGTIIEYLEIDENLAELSSVISSINIDTFFMNNKLNENEIVEHAISVCLIIMKFIFHAAKFKETTLINFYSEILKGFVALYPVETNCKKEITLKLLRNDDLNLRYIPEIHYYLIKKNIVDLAEWEIHIDQFLNDNAQLYLAKKLISSLSEKKTFTFFSCNSFKQAQFSLNKDYFTQGFINDSGFTKLSYFMFSASSHTQYFDLFYKSNHISLNYKNPLDHRDFKVDKDQFMRIKQNIRKHFADFMVKYYEKSSEKQIILEIFDHKEEEYINPLITILVEFLVEESNNIAESNIDDFFSQPQFISIFIGKCIEYLNLDKLKILENSLLSIMRIFTLDYAKNGEKFNQKPYLRLLTFLIRIIFEMSHDELKKTKKYQLFLIIADFLKLLRPSEFPAFSFAWLELISNSYLISYLINITPNEQSNITPLFSETELKKDVILAKQERYCSLLCDLLSVLGSQSNNNLRDFNSKLFLDTTIKLFYYLSVSYPDFIVSYYIGFITALPCTANDIDGFIQIKNIILSAGSYPYQSGSFIYLDFFKDDFKIDSLCEARKPIAFDVVSRLKQAGLKDLIDDSIIQHKNQSKSEELVEKMSKKHPANYQYLTCYFGINIKTWFDKKIDFKDFVEYFKRLLTLMNDENRNMIIHGLLNELRCLSQTTYFYGMLCKNLLSESKMEEIEENLMRNIVVRLIAKPYPAGLVWLERELHKTKKFEEISKRVRGNNPNFESLLNDLISFVPENYKNLENYL